MIVIRCWDHVDGGTEGGHRPAPELDTWVPLAELMFCRSGEFPKHVQNGQKPHGFV